MNQIVQLVGFYKICSMILSIQTNEKIRRKNIFHLTFRRNFFILVT